MKPMSPYQKTQVKRLIELLGKDDAGLLMHIYRLQDQHEQLSAIMQELMPKVESMLEKVDSLRPIKGVDYMTKQELADHKKHISQLVAESMPKISEESIIKKISKKIKNGKDGKPGKDAVVDHEHIAGLVLQKIPMPQIVDGEDRQEVKSMTGEDILDLLSGINPDYFKEYPDKRLDKMFIRGSERFASLMEIDYAVSKLRNQVSFLINKIESMDSQGGQSSGNVVIGEVVSGSGTSWTLAHVPVGTIQLVGNGQVLTLSVDYSISGADITTVSSWSAGEVQATYQY